LLTSYRKYQCITFTGKKKKRRKRKKKSKESKEIIVSYPRLKSWAFLLKIPRKKQYEQLRKEFETVNEMFDTYNKENKEKTK